jgi:outer membrane protein TolC
MEQDIEDNILRLQMGNEPDVIKPTGYHGWTGLVTISYPLGNKALGSAYRRSQIVHQQSERILDDVERQVVLEVRSAIRFLRNNVERLGILEKNIAGARDKLEFATVNFQLGRASNMDITDAQKDLLDAEVDWVNEVIDYRVQLARLEQLLGGF